MEVTNTFELTTVPKRTSARWFLVAPTLFLLVVVNQLDKTNIAVIMADRSFLSDMGLVGQPASIGLLSTIFFIGYGVGLLVWGFVVDRLGPRRAAMIGVCGWAVTTIWCALSHSLHQLQLARFVLGLSEGCIWPVCNSYSARWFPAREHGRIQSVWVNGNQVGIALGLPLVAALISVGGWRVAFWVLGVGSLAVLEPMLVLLAPDEPGSSPHSNDEEREYIIAHRAVKHADPNLQSLLKDLEFWAVTLCHVGTVATLFGLSIWIPTYLTQVRGLPFDALKGWVALCYALPIAVALGTGYWADRTMRPALVGAGTAGLVAAMILIAVTGINLVASVLLLVTALAAPMIYGAMNASLMQRLAPANQIGRATGIFVGVGNLVGGLAPTIVGYLIGLFRGRYVVAFGFISAVNVVLLMLYFLMDRNWKPLERALPG